ncbi:uncharacterized protein LOC144909703 [Branchiostoma floridae x Branchiostoma belcheri]
MGKLTTEAGAKTAPEDPPPYPLEPLPTKPVLQTNIVMPEPVPGVPPARARRCPKKCKTVSLLSVIAVLVVGLIVLGVLLGKKHMMMAGKHGCRGSGERGDMGRDCDEMEDMDDMDDSDEQDGEADGQDADQQGRYWISCGFMELGCRNLG